MPKRTDDLNSDPLLHAAPSVGGFKVLDPAVLYAKVGQGGMGAVYRGRHFSLDCDVAVKVLKPDLALDEQYVLRFEREARLAARITSDNVVRVLDVRESHGVHYLVMEFVRGETARERVQRKGPLSQAEALAILVGVVRGLTFAHKAGIVHRDIKPENVLVSTEGAVKLADLGLAKAKSSGGQSMTALTTGVMGTPQYMPPEQWQSPNVTPASDIWALGATLYYLLAGKSGIEADELFNMGMRIRDCDFPRLDEVRKDVRKEVVELVAKCTARDPAARYADAMELLKALHELGAVDSDVLVDGQSGLGSARMSTVTPPPKATLARIKLQLRESDAQAATLPTVESPRQQAADGGSVARQVVRSRTAVLALLLAVLGMASFGYTQGWFGAGKPPMDPTGERTEGGDQAAPKRGPEPPAPAVGNTAAALEAYARGMMELPKVDRLDAAIDAFEMALQLDAGFEEAKQKLVLALVTRSKELQTDDLDEAYRRIARARELLPQDGSWTPVAKRVEAALSARVLAGLTVEAPTEDAMLATRSIEVRGRMVAESYRTLRVAIEPRADGIVRPFPRATAQAVQVVAGRFASSIVVSADGAYVLRVEVEDRNGIFVELPVRAIGSDTVAPELTVAEPSSDSLVGSKVMLKGTVTDRSAVVVTVDGLPAAVADGNWSLATRLPDGVRDLLVLVRDAAGLEQKLKHRLRVDGTPPTIELSKVPSVTAADSLTLRGSVRDGNAVRLLIAAKEIQVAADGGFEYPWSLGGEGSVELELVAVDAVGNRAAQTLVVRVDRTAPVLTWQSPTNVTVLPGKVRVTGTVVDAGPCLVEVNGKSVAVTGGEWQEELQVTAGQTLAVRVVAVDELGNSAKSLSRTLICKPEVVALGWADPVADAGTVKVGGETYPRMVVEKTTGMRMVLIEPGEFQMGSPDGEAERGADEQQHRRVIQKAFWLGQTEVSQAQWQKVMNNNPSNFKDDLSCPVEQVSWNDCQDFVKKLNGAATGPFRLPSESQWEYACRAGTTTPFSFGRTITPEQVNYDGNYPYGGAAMGQYRQRTVKVGSLPANPWGLHEMHGNVWEWCQDAYGTYPNAGTEEPAATGGSRVLRGGSWGGFARYCRSAGRGVYDPSLRHGIIGFRLSRTL